MMADTKIAPISGVAKPSKRMLRIATALHGDKFCRSIGAMLNDAKAVDILAGVLDRALMAGLKSDGRIDLREAALHVIQELRRHQR
jgi:hypothetical protein